MTCLPRSWRRMLMTVAMALLAAGSPTTRVTAQPSGGAVTLVVGAAAGGPTDALARALGAGLAAQLGSVVTVANLPGSAGILAADRVAKAAPDGMTIGLFTALHAAVPGLRPRLPYHPVEDFTPIGFVGDGASILVIHPALPARSLLELVALARTVPTPLLLAAPGPAGFQVAAEMLRLETAMVFERLPYRSAAQATQAVLTGAAQLTLANVAEVAAPVRAGLLRALGTTGPTRSALLADVPTFRELGLPEFQGDSWFGLLGPRGIPAAAAAALHGALGAVLADPAAQEAMRALGVEPRAMPRGEWGAFLKRETARWTATARASGARLD